jgi:hypothetical protein
MNHIIINLWHSDINLMILLQFVVKIINLEIDKFNNNSYSHRFLIAKILLILKYQIKNRRMQVIKISLNLLK